MAWLPNLPQEPDLTGAGLAKAKTQKAGAYAGAAARSDDASLAAMASVAALAALLESGESQKNNLCSQWRKDALSQAVSSSLAKWGQDRSADAELVGKVQKMKHSGLSGQIWLAFHKGEAAKADDLDLDRWRFARSTAQAAMDSHDADAGSQCKARPQKL